MHGVALVISKQKSAPSATQKIIDQWTHVNKTNEYHKLLEELKVENITLPDQFVPGFLIEKLPKSWKDYNNQLKHKQNQLPLTYLITHIIIEDTNKKESKATKAKSFVS
ncbi:unnamed protein product [Vicia faba]|uniref:Uncharacterized protein n=1 Tax=Vicia faba TaxID=3906 RepID=A0AAV0Z1H3_VICFA|nr:unnamed protein product [Vicia faba]